MSSEPILQIRDLKKHYPLRGGLFSGVKAIVKAVDGVSFNLMRGETFGLVGESGCGKSTLARNLIRLETPTSGEVLLNGRDLASARRRDLFLLRREMQMIFQDPYSSLNPRMTAGEIVREPLAIHSIGRRSEQRERVLELLRQVGLSEAQADRYPHEFSGGQRQRIGIARALALEPELILADEPVSALDVSVQAQVINLMVKLQRERSLTYLFISHDLSVVDYISDRIGIMYLGRLVEIGPKTEIFNRPAHPYTKALIASSPIADPRKRREALPIEGELPSPVNPPPGCPFHTRCPYAIAECQQTVPRLEAAAGAQSDGPQAHLAACIRKNDIPGGS